MLWLRRGGPFALQTLIEMGQTPAAEDYGPSLAWEGPVWRLYQQCQRQIRVGLGGLVGLDFSVFMPLIERRGWDMDVALDLLGAIEDGLTADRNAANEDRAEDE